MRGDVPGDRSLSPTPSPWFAPIATRTMIVIDATVLVVALADDGPDGDLVRDRLRRESLTAPDLVDLEVVSVLRRLHRAGGLDARRGTLAVRDLHDLPFDRVPHRALVQRCWELRGNFTAYDAAYVALAEALDVPLMTADQRLASAPGLPCVVETITGE